MPDTDCVLNLRSWPFCYVRFYSCFISKLWKKKNLDWFWFCYIQYEFHDFASILIYKLWILPFNLNYLVLKLLTAALWRYSLPEASGEGLILNARERYNFYPALIISFSEQSGVGCGSWYIGLCWWQGKGKTALTEMVMGALCLLKAKEKFLEILEQNQTNFFNRMEWFPRNSEYVWFC